MAVNKRKKSSGGAHWAVGLNVVLMVVLAVAFAGGLQWIGYSYSTRADLTSSGVNSLTDATKNMLADLQGNVTLTSMYFKTDLEDEDQDRFRSTVDDLLELYRATNRTKISASALNPLQDQDKRREVFIRLAGLSKFKEEAAGHVEAISLFQNEIIEQITALTAGELAQMEAFTALEGQSAQLVAQVKQLYSALQDDLGQASLDIKDALASDVPAHGAATAGIRQAYATMSGLLRNVTEVGLQLATTPDLLPPQVAAFFIESADRYADLLATLETEQAKIQALPMLTIDDILRELQSETGNPILVEAAGEAKVISFRDVWPANNPQAASAGFADRRFLGEQKLTSAIVHLTQKEKPAVVFIRFGGPPLFIGGFMPGQPPAVLRQMEAQLEDANFTVHEWDLAGQDGMPHIDPPPSRTLYVIMRPTQPQRGPFGQSPQQASFSPKNLATVKKALGDAPRAIFLTGWTPAMGPSAGYEYADYIADTWGIEAPGDRLAIQADPIGNQKYRFVRAPLQFTQPRFSDHPVVSGLAQQRTTFPLISPIREAEALPDGVAVERLAWLDEKDGIWSIADVNHYQQQVANEYILRNAQDFSGEFSVALVATKGEGKIVVISASDFAIDEVALASEMVVTSQGLAVRPRNPGNAAFFINSLHWLNDNTAWMNLGTPIDNTAIAIDKNSSAMTFVRVLVLAIWPGLAMCGGFIIWFVRRR